MTDETDVCVRYPWIAARDRASAFSVFAKRGPMAGDSGDVLNHGPRNALPEGYAPAQVAEKLNPFASRIIAVRGNCDSEVDQMLLHFPLTAPWQQVLLENSRLFLTHGHLFGPDNLPALAAGDVWFTAILIFRWLKTR